MKRIMKRMFALAMAFVMMAGVFAGTGLAADAAGIPTIWSVEAEPASLTNAGGTAKITVSGADLTENVWYKVSCGDTLVVEKEAAATESATKAEFDVVIPANTKAEGVTYTVTVRDSEPQMNWATGTLNWSNSKTATITVAAGEGGTTPDPEEPSDKVLCDETHFRAKVVDEEGNALSGVEFALEKDWLPGYPAKVKTDADGVLEYKLASEDWGTIFDVAVSEEYEMDPAEITFATAAQAPAKIKTVNGTPLAEITDEIVITVKGATSTPTPEPEPVDKAMLQYYAYEYHVTNDGYTAASYQAYEDAVAAGKTVYQDADATQAEVDAALQAIKDAMKALKKDEPSVEPENSTVCDETHFRAIVVDEEGNALSGVVFNFAPSWNPSWPTKVTTDAEGLLVYELKSYDYESTFVITVNGTEYKMDPAEMSFTTDDSKAVITTINGTPLAEVTEEIYITLKAASTPSEPTVNTKELEDEIFFAESKKAADYTPDSFKVLTDALAAAKAVLKDETADQAAVNAAVKALKDARLALVEAEKVPVCDMYSIRIQVVDEDGNKVTERIEFARYIGSSRGRTYSNNGVVEYTLYPDDAYAKTIRFAYEGENIVIDGVEYEVTPAEHVFTIDEDALGTVLTHINGVALEGTAEVKFVLKKVVAEEPESPFEDVATNAYYYDAVLWAVENNVTKGKTATTFEPGSNCTRAQIVTFLWRANGCPEPQTTANPFTDVSEGAYYYKAVLWAVENGITAGKTATTFLPNAGCTRAQVMTFLWRAEGQPEPASAECNFTDLSENSFYYKAVLWAVENNITTGKTPTTFAPDSICTRAQIVTFLYKAIGK